MRPVLALILGGAGNLQADLDAFEGFGVEPSYVLAVNDVGTLPGRLDFWVSLHPEKLPGWMAQRSGPMTYEIFIPPDEELAQPASIPGAERYSCYWDGVAAPGSVGLYAVKIAQIISDIQVLAGVPLEAHYGHLNDPAPWKEAEHHQQTWREVKPLLGTVRSMSGWTRRRLGAPTKEWLLGI